MKRLHLFLLTGCLTLIGGSGFFYKVFYLDYPLTSEVTSLIWNVEAHVSFSRPRRGPASISMFIPQSTRRFEILSENFVSRGYTIQTDAQGMNRKAGWSTRRAKGEQNLYYRVLVRRIQTGEAPAPPPPPVPEKPFYQGLHSQAATSLLAEIRQKTKTVPGVVIELINRMHATRPDDRVQLLMREQDSLRKKIQVMVRLLALEGIPARAVHGLRLEAQTATVPVASLLEVYDGKRWRYFDPVSGAEGISDDFLIWWRGAEPMVQGEGAERLKVTLTVLLDQEMAIRSAIARKQVYRSLFLEYSLFSLPVQTQAVYRVLLLVPVGAFFLVFLRNVVGLKTFGTFMPVLIALSFRETQLLWGIALFGMLVMFGMIIRLYLEHLKLLVVPRLGAVLIVVVLMMVGFSVLTHKLGLERGLSVALFPMVILTMTIERMSVVWDELGPREALQQAVGSVAAAAAAYFLMSLDSIEYLVYVFPELLLILLAATILLGRYSGYRLMELRRFGELTKE